MKPISGILITAVIIILTGCENLDQMMKDLQKTTSPTPSSTSASQSNGSFSNSQKLMLLQKDIPKICQEAKSNRIRANEKYKNQPISIIAKVSGFSSSLDRWEINLDVGDNIVLSAYTKDQLGIRRLNVDQKTRIIGNIYRVGYIGMTCILTIENAHF